MIKSVVFFHMGVCVCGGVFVMKKLDDYCSMQPLEGERD